MGHVRYSVILFVILLVLFVLIIIPSCMTLSFHVEDKPTQDQRYELKGIKYPLVPFPLLDTLDIPQAFKNKFYLRFLLKCVFFQGYCDIIGKWLKPRAIAGLFGTCLECTEFQKAHMNEWLELLADLNPQEFRAAMVKVCVDLELPVGQQDLQLIQPYYKK